LPPLKEPGYKTPQFATPILKTPQLSPLRDKKSHKVDKEPFLTIDHPNPSYSSTPITQTETPSQAYNKWYVPFEMRFKQQNSLKTK